MLLAVRCNVSGQYHDSEQLTALSVRFKVPEVKRLMDLEAMGFKSLCRVVKGWQDREGVIVKFTNGAWVKVKSAW